MKNLTAMYAHQSLSTLKVGVILITALLLSNCSSPIKYQSRDGRFGNSASDHQVNKSNAPCNGFYRVVYGDTLGEIASQCQVSMTDLAKENDLLPPYFIYVNQELKVPESIADASKKGRSSVPLHSTPSSGSSKTVKRAATAKATLSAPRIASRAAQSKRSSGWRWPTQKNLPYQYINDSQGASVLEVYGGIGQAVTAVSAGKIVYAGDGIVNYGNMIVVKHDDDYMSIYAHNQRLLVKEGDRVVQGQKIAILGATGHTLKPKLYLEARYQGRKIDVRNVLNH